MIILFIISTIPFICPGNKGTLILVGCKRTSIHQIGLAYSNHPIPVSLLNFFQCAIQSLEGSTVHRLAGNTCKPYFSALVPEPEADFV